MKFIIYYHLISVSFILFFNIKIHFFIIPFLGVFYLFENIFFREKNYIY